MAKNLFFVEKWEFWQSWTISPDKTWSAGCFLREKRENAALLSQAGL